MSHDSLLMLWFLHQYASITLHHTIHLKANELRAEFDVLSGKNYSMTMHVLDFRIMCKCNYIILKTSCEVVSCVKNSTFKGNILQKHQ